MDTPLSEIVKNNHRCFYRITDENKKYEQINAIQYIIRLGKITGTPIGDMPVFRLFNDGSGKKRILTDKNAINKIFMEHAEAIKAKKNIVEKPEPPAESSKWDNASRDVLQKKLNQYSIDPGNCDYLTNQRNHFAEKCSIHYSHYESDLRQMVRLNFELFSKDIFLSLPDQIVSIEKDGFFVFDRMAGLTLEFLTKNNVILKHKNTDVGIDMSVNMGRYRVIVSISGDENSLIRVYSHSDNPITESRFYHPHIDSEGKVCWGTAQSNVFRSLSRHNIHSVLSVLRVVLTSYNHQSPYRPLELFQEHRLKMLELEAKREQERQEASQSNPPLNTGNITITPGAVFSTENLNPNRPIPPHLARGDSIPENTIAEEVSRDIRRHFANMDIREGRIIGDPLPNPENAEANQPNRRIAAVDLAENGERVPRDMHRSLNRSRAPSPMPNPENGRFDRREPSVAEVRSWRSGTEMPDEEVIDRAVVERSEETDLPF